MSLAQENFDRATKSASDALFRLRQHSISSLHRIELSSQNTRSLQTLAWDLEAIQTAIRMELNDRSETPMDLA